MAVGLRDLDSNLRAASRQIEVTGSPVTGIAPCSDGHILVIAAVAHTGSRRDLEPRLTRLAGGVRTLHTGLPGSFITDRDPRRGIRVVGQFDRIGVAAERRYPLIVGTARERSGRQGEHHAYMILEFHTQFD